MTSPNDELFGAIHGNTIQLESDLGLPDGQPVRVVVVPITQQETRQPGDGIRRSAGAWADEAEEVDKFLEWNRAQRKIDRPPIEP